MSISVTNPINLAWNRMVLVLFKPFDIGKWFVIGFCAFLAYLGQGGGANFQIPNFGGGGGPRPTNFPNPGTPYPSGPHTPGPTFPGPGGPGPASPSPGAPSPVFQPRSPDPFEEMIQWARSHVALIVLIAVALVILMFALTLVLMWLRSRGRFMFIHALVTNTGAVVEPWKEFRTLGNSLFKALIALSVIAMFGWLLIIGLAALIALPDIRDRTFGAPAIVAIILGAFFFIAFALFWAFVMAVIDGIVVPGMYARREKFMPVWRAVREEFLRPHLGAVILFCLMRLALAIGCGIAAGIATCLTCCIAALPYIGTVILLPIFAFQQSYPLYFVDQKGGRWRVFPENPDEPTCPACGYDLRGSMHATHCPECGHSLIEPMPLPDDEPPAMPA